MFKRIKCWLGLHEYIIKARAYNKDKKMLYHLECKCCADTLFVTYGNLPYKRMSNMFTRYCRCGHNLESGDHVNTRNGCRGMMTSCCSNCKSISRWCRCISHTWILVDEKRIPCGYKDLDKSGNRITKEKVEC